MQKGLSAGLMALGEGGHQGFGIVTVDLLAAPAKLLNRSVKGSILITDSVGPSAQDPLASTIATRLLAR